MNDALKTIFSTQSRKAWFGAVITLLGSLQVAIGEGGTFADVTVYEWFGVVIVTLTTFAGVYGVSNGPGPYDQFGYPIQTSDAKYIQKLEEQLDEMAKVVKVPANRVDTASSAPATMNTIRASDV